jgi:hypothetical protein
MPAPPGDLFDKSLQAELEKHPELLTVTRKQADNDPPEVLFRARLKGYYLSPKVCRVWILRVLRDSRKRGVFFVKWVDPITGAVYDGSKVFAHFATIRYLQLHVPGMSVIFDVNGAIKSTSVHVRTIRQYIWAYRYVLARRCHDMAKQMYSNRTYAPDAWKPLKDWLYPQDTPNITTVRLQRMLGFNKSDSEFHAIVAKCLWSLANGPNLPWGRSAVKLLAYSAVPITEKVGQANMQET